jgi:hypothetical protein
MGKFRNIICLLLLKLTVKISRNQQQNWEIKTDGCFRTYKFRKFNLVSSTPEMVQIEDIAKGLAYKPHFSGFTPQFFSIAEHSLLVQKLVAEQYPDDYKLQLDALLHDGSEAYTGDMIKPLKNLLPNFVVIENKIQDAIYKKFGIIHNKSIIKRADNLAQDIEASVFYGANPFMQEKYIRYLSPNSSFGDFLNKYNYLMYKIKRADLVD